MPKTNLLSAALRASAQAAAPPHSKVRAAALEPGDGRRLVGAHFPSSVHRQLRILAVSEDRTKDPPALRRLARLPGGRSGVVSHNDSLNRRDLEPDYSVSDWVGNRFNLAWGTV